MTGKIRRVAVLGAGAWGTTLAWMLARKGLPVSLWARRPQLAEQIRRSRRNEAYRPEIQLPANVLVTADVQQAAEGAEVVIVAVPSHVLRVVLQTAAPHIASSTDVVIAAKGIERGSGKRMSQVAAEVLHRLNGKGITVLSGPNLSEEIAHGMPAAAVVASTDEASMQKCQGLFASDLFRVYTNCDIIGVELCGAYKNIIALAAGISDGLGYGENTKAALISRGLVEMAAVVVRSGGSATTCWGLAGVGDLMATCHSRLSRNWTVGYAIGRGHSVDEAIAQIAGIAEGIYTTAAIVETAKDVELPIARAVYNILYGGAQPAEQARQLMTRAWRAETAAWHEIGLGPVQ